MYPEYFKRPLFNHDSLVFFHIPHSFNSNQFACQSIPVIVHTLCASEALSGTDWGDEMRHVYLHEKHQGCDRPDDLSLCIIFKNYTKTFYSMTLSPPSTSHITCAHRHRSPRPHAQNILVALSFILISELTCGSERI